MRLFRLIVIGTACLLAIASLIWLATPYVASMTTGADGERPNSAYRNVAVDLTVSGVDGEAFHARPDGTPAYSERYDYVDDFSEGLARVELNGTMFHILPDGSPAYDERYSYVADFSGGMARVVTPQEWFKIRPDGTRVN